MESLDHPPIASGSLRAALRLLQLGAVAVVLSASIYRAFDLDRFLVPKDLALHLTALLVGLLTLRAVTRLAVGWSDVLLAGWFMLGAVSALWAANEWLAIRALAITASSLAIFWSARALGEAGLARRVAGAVAVAVVIAALTSLCQTYGLWIDLFSANRAPGGTLGNRNFVAHAAAFGLPLLLYFALGAARAGGRLAATLGTAIVTTTLILTRSRGAWLAAGAVMLIMLGAIVGSAPLRRDARSWTRLGLVLLAIGGGVAAALLIPNTLRWRSDNPYLESVVGVANYDEGSGRGRLVQYERSLQLAVADPIFGVGAGNWPVAYPEVAARRDPSMNPAEGGMTFNPWPSSDWIAFISERGIPATLALALVFVGALGRGVRRLFGAVDLQEALGAMAFVGTLVAANVAGAFDAVLLLALPSLLVWAVLGALWPSPRHFERSEESPHSGDSSSTLLAMPGRLLIALMASAVLAGAAVGAARSAAQLVAMEIYSTRGERTSLAQASRIDPGNYRLHLRLARSGSRRVRCEHALAARDLFPASHEARSLARGCGGE